MSRLAKDAAEASTHEENRPESDKDMRSTEASYLARGQMQRARDLERSRSLLTALDVSVRNPGTPISVGCVVVLTSSGKTQVVFMSSGGGGLRAVVEGTEVSTVTMQTPMGKALAGLFAGDEAEMVLAGQKRVFEIVDVY